MSKSNSTITRTIEVELTPEDLARAFLEMDAKQQAQVLMNIGMWSVDLWGEYKANLQWNALGQELAESTWAPGRGLHFIEFTAAVVRGHLDHPRRPPLQAQNLPRSEWDIRHTADPQRTGETP